MCIRPVILYACPIWSNTCDTNYKRLQIIQNKCLRMIIDAEPGISNKKLHELANIPKLKELVHKHATNFYSSKLTNITILQEVCKTSSNSWLKYKVPNQVMIDDHSQTKDIKKSAVLIEGCVTKK